MRSSKAHELYEIVTTHPVIPQSRQARLSQRQLEASSLRAASTSREAMHEGMYWRRHPAAPPLPRQAGCIRGLWRSFSHVQNDVCVGALPVTQSSISKSRFTEHSLIQILPACREPRWHEHVNGEQHLESKCADAATR